MRLFLIKPSPLAQAATKAAPLAAATPKASTRPSLASITSKATRMALALLLASSMSMPLAGCKDTDVLAETIIDQDAEYTDETLDPIRQESSAGEDDDIQSATEEETADRVDEQDNSLSQYDNDSESDQSTDQRESTDVADEYNASEGDDPTDADNASGDNDDSEDEEEDSSTPEEGDSDEGAQSDEDDPDDEEDTQDPDTSSGQGGTDNIYGQDGTYTDLPDNVRGIAATGLYAIIVQMLAGEGGLVGADEETLETMQESAAFSGEGVESVREVWTGSEGARDLDITALIQSGADVVLTSENDPTVPTDDESLATLDSYGIRVVVMPTIGEVDTPDDYILTAIAVVGELLSDANTDYDTVNMAALYRQMHDEVINYLVDTNGGYAQEAYVGGGIPSGGYYIYQAGGTNSGIRTTRGYYAQINTAFANAIYSSSKTSATMDRSWNGDDSTYRDEETVDLTDGIAVGISASGYYDQAFALFDYYLQCAGVVDSSVGSEVGGSRLSSSPFILSTGSALDGLGLSLGFSTQGGYNPLWFRIGSGYLDTVPFCTLGDTSSSLSFPGIVTRNESIAQAIKSSGDKVDGYYNLGYSYSIYVLPSSNLTGSWIDGTPESFLSAIWAYGIFQKNDLSECSKYINEYCATFYRCGGDDVINSYGTVYEANCPTS